MIPELSDTTTFSLDTPALVIDVDKVTYNIEQAIRIAGKVEKLRPHVKTHKMLDVARMQIKAGILKFKCATIAEAEMLAMAGAEDVLIAYPVQGPKVSRAIALGKKYPSTQFSVLVDNAASASQINAYSAEEGVATHVYIDINNGQDRTGIKPEKVPDLVASLYLLKHIKLIGLHTYDGHIHMSSYEDRVKACRKDFEPVLKLYKELQRHFDYNLAMVAGGSPTFSVHARYHDVECSPGTFIFWDENYSNKYKEQGFLKAAVIASRVISKINDFTYCLDLGYKSVANENPLPRIALITDMEVEQIGHSEEHLVIKSNKENAFEIGEMIIGYPYHICPTVALYEEAVVVRNGEIIDRWKTTARTRKINV